MLKDGILSPSLKNLISVVKHHSLGGRGCPDVGKGDLFTQNIIFFSWMTKRDQDREGQKENMEMKHTKPRGTQKGKF